MADCRITHVRVSGDDHESITHLGRAEKLGDDGWIWTKEQVIESIEKETNTFFTFEDKKRADVFVRDADPKYVQTGADGKWTNNLLALPRF
jgi:hypothetical protein